MKKALGAETGVRIAAAAAYQAQNVDLPLGPGDVVTFGDEALEARATPGRPEQEPDERSGAWAP